MDGVVHVGVTSRIRLNGGRGLSGREVTRWIDSQETRVRILDGTKKIEMSSDGICSRVVSVLDSGAEGPGFKSQSRRCRVTVLGKLFTHIVPLFTKQQNW